MEMAYTGFRLSNEQLSRAQKLAQQLGMSRNRLIGLLIDQAEIKVQPVVEVSLVPTNIQPLEKPNARSKRAFGKAANIR